METQVEKFTEIVWLLMGIVNSIDRTSTTMVVTYPNWDDTDMAEFKTLTIARLNAAIAKVDLL
jgi:hypothetical protein